MHRSVFHTLASLALVPVALALLSSCSGDPGSSPPRYSTPRPPATTAPPTADPVTDPVADPASEPSPAPGATRVTRTSICLASAPLPRPFTGKAADHFGADPVMDAYCEIGGFFHSQTITSATTHPVVRPDQLDFVKDALTPDAKTSWDLAVRHAPRGDSDAVDAVGGLTYYNLPVQSFGYAFPAGQATSLGGSVSTARTDVVRLGDGRDALAMSFTVDNHLALVAAADPRADPTHQMPLTRQVAVRLLPNPDPSQTDHDWLIESWHTTWSTRPVQPLPST